MRAKDLIEIFPRIFRGIAKAFKCVAQAISDILKNLLAKKEVETMQLKQLQQRIRQEQLFYHFNPCHMQFADGIKNCLQSDPTRYGVVTPKLIDDVLVPNPLERIFGTLLPNGMYQNVVFQFEVKRCPTNVNLQTIATGTGAYVPVEDAQSELQSELPKYIGNFVYAGLSVYETENRKIRIVVYDVR